MGFKDLTGRIKKLLRSKLNSDRSAVQSAKTQSELETITRLEDRIAELDQTKTSSRKVQLHYLRTLQSLDLVNLALATKSRFLLDPLSNLASLGESDLAGLKEKFIGPSATKQKQSATSEEAPGGYDRGFLAQLGRVLWQLQTEPSDRELAIAIVQYLVQSRSESDPKSQLAKLPSSSFPFVLGTLLGELPELVDSTLSDPIWAIAEPQAEAFLADRLNPFRPNANNELVEPWLAQFNLHYRRFGLEEVTLSADSSLEPFDRISSTKASPVLDGPLVTVITSCYKPDRSLLSSVNSILNQSWQNFEYLLVDDASGSEYLELFDEVAALDQRIRVFHREQNSGTYQCRNFALQLASGDFVTFQDDDDWSHPRRLELQANYLIENPERIVCHTKFARVTPTLQFGFENRLMFLKTSEPSTMFRKKEVLERVGYFDPVRKAADSEFKHRIETVFSQRSRELPIEAPLVLAKHSPASLSGSEFGDHWAHESRLAYRQSWTYWHRKLKTKANPLPAEPSAARAFPAPRKTQGLDPHNPVQKVQELHLLSRRVSESQLLNLLTPSRKSAESATKAADLAAVVLASPNSFSKLFGCPESILERIHSGEILLGLLSESFRAKQLVVHDPASLQFADELESYSTAERVSIIATADQIDGVDYDRATVEANIQKLFGTKKNEISWQEPLGTK